MPHRVCLLAQHGEWLVTAMGTADVVIFAQSMLFPWLFVLAAWGQLWIPRPIRSATYWTAAFVTACGMTHGIAALNLANSYYLAELAVKAVCALAGIGAGRALWVALRSWRAVVWLDAMREGFRVLREGADGG